MNEQMNDYFDGAENYIEDQISELLRELGYQEYEEAFNKNSNWQVIDFELLKTQLIKINQNLEIDYINQAIQKIKQLSFGDIREGNITIINTFLRDGIGVKIENLNNERLMQVKLIDFNNLENNAFKFIRQLNVFANKYGTLIPDIVIYINGLPLSMIELKKPNAKEKLVDAYDQLKNYQIRKPELGYWNLFALVSNGFDTKYGSLFADFSSYWWAWKRRSIDLEIEQDLANDVPGAFFNFKKNVVGIYDKKTFIKILKSYIFYAETNQKNPKVYVPSYYQFYGTEKAINSIKKCQNGKGGVLWHTQGVGKSVTMVFLAKRIKEEFDINQKIIYVTDRKDLDVQLYKRFEDAKNYLLKQPIQIKSRSEIREILSNDNDFGIYMTTIQKFTEATDVLSLKTNVIIIADEAHRSHNNTDTELVLNENKIEEKEGYAKYIRDAFPNATYLGFTGTPLIGDKKTTDIFGPIIDQYPMNQAVLDGATVPIHYERRNINIGLDEKILKEIDEIYQNQIDESASDIVNKERKKRIQNGVARLRHFLTAPDTIKKVVSDFWHHYYLRKDVLNGKAMFVALDREIAFKVYQEMLRQKPDYKDKIKLVITGSNKDTDQEMINLIPNDDTKKMYADEFKKPDGKIKIVVVVDMWLTGFDVQDLDTLYLFKVIRKHNLMQTIARVNRRFTDNKTKKIKEDGLIVDYIGIWHYIQEALKDYGGVNKEINYDIEDIKIKLKDLLTEMHRKYFLNQDLNKIWINADDKQRYTFLINAHDVILNLKKNEQDLFFAKVHKLHRWLKLSKASLDKSAILEATFYVLLKSFVINTSIENDEIVNVQKTIEILKEKLDEAIITGEIQVSKINLSGRKDLAYISTLLEQEKSQFKNLSKLQIKEIENQMKAELKYLAKSSPLTSQKLSQHLKELIAKYEEDHDSEKICDGLIKMAIIVLEEIDKSKIVEDENLRAFYSILADEQFKIKTWDSVIMKEIVLKIKKILDDDITEQWWENSKIRAKIKTNIKLMLKKDYDYPPNKQDDITNKLVNEINEIMKNNQDYFIHGEKK